MKSSDKRDLLVNKIRMLVGDINNSRTNIEINCHKKANEGVAFEMESTGVSREQAFGVVYSNVYTNQMDRIQGLVLKKQLAEVELFILSGKSLTEAVKESWTKDMVEFYKDRMSNYEKGKNIEGDVSKADISMEDEVANDSSADADFMTQNIVSNVVDAAMVNIIDNENAGPSSSVK